MATLTSRTPGNPDQTYRGLLRVEGFVSASPLRVEDGLGTALPMLVATVGITFDGPVTIDTLTLTNPLGIGSGGTGGATAQAARTNLLPAQASQAGKALVTNGTDVAWTSIATTLLNTDGGLTISGSGTITVNLAVPVTIPHGGTGAITASGARANLLPSYSGQAGKFLQVNGGGTDVQWVAVSGGAGGTVTSVALTVPGFLSVAGSPITTAGTLAVTLATQAANTVFAGPASGGPAAPTFRLLGGEEVVYDPADSGLAATDTQGAIDELVELIANSGGATNQGSWLVSGGGVAWVSSFVFNVAASNYFIQGINYSSPGAQVTLNPADPSDDRFDLIVVDTAGVTSVVEGTPASTPAFPVIDPQTQLVLTAILVEASATEPGNVVSQLIYDENTGGPAEWTASASAGTIVTNSTNNPGHGTICVEGTAALAGQYFEFEAPADVAVNDFQSLVFYWRNKSAWPSKTYSVTIELLDAAGTRVGNAVSLRDGILGFNSSLTGAYQVIVIPVISFSVPGILGAVTHKIRFTVGPAAVSIGFYFDFASWQSNEDSPVPSSDGTVTSVGLALPDPVFSVLGTPITTAGTLVATFKTQVANTVFAGPGTGSPASPTFRALVLADLPDLDAEDIDYDNSGSGLSAVNVQDAIDELEGLIGGGSGTVTSVALTVPGFLSVAGSPVTTSGTLAVTLATQSANTVFAGPTTGGAAAPTFRALVAADVPDLSGTYVTLTTAQNIDGAKTFRVLQTFTTSTNSVIPVVLKAHATQTADLEQKRDSSDNVLSSTDKDGLEYPYPVTFNAAPGAPAVVGTNVTTFRAIVGRHGKIIKTWAYANTGPTGADLILDINKNGTSIWASTQANRLKIVDGQQLGNQTSFDTVTVAPGDLLTLDIDQVGDDIAGQDITVLVEIDAKNAGSDSGHVAAGSDS